MFILMNSTGKYLRFSWKGNLYQFTDFPNGLAFCSRKFTKCLKPVYFALRRKGHLSVGYIDDSDLQASEFIPCVNKCY